MKWGLAVFLLLFIYSCNTTPGFTERKRLHEAYAKKLKQAGLDETVMGKRWFEAAENSLAQPLAISLPYSQKGYFPPDNPSAIGLAFSAKRGQKLSFRLQTKSSAGVTVFTELWQQEEAGEPVFIQSADTIRPHFEYEVEDDGNFILRLQPELLGGTEYEIQIGIGASLAFPVAGSRAKIGSFWGADRDGGARKHEGVDIFDAKRTPVVAAANGRVTRIGDGGIGGKVVWMKPSGKPISLYYAHLDAITVQDGQRVKAGDTLGLMGNTGNARTTPPHLHFGIYAYGGAIDPQHFIDRSAKKIPFAGIRSEELNRFYRSTKEIRLGTKRLPKHTILWVGAGDGQDYIGLLPDNTALKIKRKDAQLADNQLFEEKIEDAIMLQDGPDPDAAGITILKPETRIKVMGYYKEFVLVKTDTGQKGWITNE